MNFNTDFDIKNKIECIDQEDIQIIRSNVFGKDIENIEDNNQSYIPYFFIRDHLDTKNYRISISFEHLNKNFGLDIGIIRDFNKLHLSLSELTTFLSKFDHVQSIETEKTFINISNYTSVKNLDTSIFIISKTFNNVSSETVVYFSKDFSNINLFLEKEKE